MSDSASYSRQVQPEHLPALLTVEGARAQLERAYRERAEAMAEAARVGASLENIGRAAGVTRERVRQILAGHLAEADSARHAGMRPSRYVAEEKAGGVI